LWSLLLLYILPLPVLFWRLTIYYIVCSCCCVCVYTNRSRCQIVSRLFTSKWPFLFEGHQRGDRHDYIVLAIRACPGLLRKRNRLVHTHTHPHNIHVMVQILDGDDEDSRRFITVNWAPFTTGESALTRHPLAETLTPSPRKQPQRLMACTGTRAHVIQHSDTGSSPHKSPDLAGLKPRVYTKHNYNIIIIYYIIIFGWVSVVVVTAEHRCFVFLIVVTMRLFMIGGPKYFVLSGLYILSIYIV